MAKKLYKKTGNNTYEIQGILPTETEWGKVVLTDTNQKITGTKTFDVAYANVFATGEGEGNYFQCRKFRGEGDASTYYHALEFGYAGHNQWDFFEYGGIYNFYQNTTSDGSGKVNLFQISPDGVTSHKPLIAESTLTAKGAFTSSTSTTLSSVKNAGILGTDSSGKVCDNSSKYQKAGDYATKSDLNNYQPKGNYVTTDTAQTITGRKTFNSPADVNGKEVATAIFKTSNGGRLIIGKEGPNSGTMLRFDQTAGTTRLQFRASATPGAMVWTQPEKGAALYFDLTNSAGASTRTTLDARSGTIARTSDIKNKKITIQKNGTEVGNFTTNPSSDKTINISLSKNDVGLGNVDNTADKDKSVKYASSAGDASNAFKLVSEDKQTEYDWITIHNIFDRISDLERYTKVYYVDTNKTTSNSHGTPINSKFESNAEMISSDMSTNFDTYPTNQCIYADRVGDVTPNELKVGDIIVIDGYLSRYVSDKTTVSTSSSGQASVIRVKFTAINKQYLDRINGKANVGHTHAISEITNLQSTLNGKADVGHGHAISAINNLQDTLDRKQNKIEYPCSFNGSNGNYVKLIRAGTNNYYVEIERGRVTYNGPTTQYPEIKVTFPREFNVTSVNDKPTVIVSFAPTSNSTGTYEALKVIDVTSTGFTVITRMSASISGGYFRVNWIAIHTV